MPKPPNRVSAENHSFFIGIEGRSEHAITLNIGRDAQGRVIEIAISEAGKMGQGLQLLLSDLGLKISRAIQGRSPMTGAEL